jgi:DNA-binding response OmpR family regulator
MDVGTLTLTYSSLTDARRTVMARNQQMILIVTDDDSMARALEGPLRESNYATLTAQDTAAALSAAREKTPALIIVDRSLRSFEKLRSDQSLRHIPMMLVARPGLDCAEEECAEDLDRGMDASFCRQSYRQIVARIRAMLRRANLQEAGPVRYAVGGLTVDLVRHEVLVDDHPVELTPREFQILQQLIQYPGRVFSRRELLDRIWGEGYALEEHTIDVHVHSLRRKIETDPAHPRFIMTVRGVGYKLKAQ